MASYVNYIEAQGARVVPIIYGEPKEVTIDKLSKINGVLMPGGAGDYYELAGTILDYIKTENEKGKYYPLWGICLGFEFINQHVSDNKDDVLGTFDLYFESLKLKFPC